MSVPAFTNEPLFTRSQVLDMLSLRPCHVTGMHTPEHHLDYTCEIQKGEAFDRALKILMATEDEVPKHLHDDCYWCHGQDPVACASSANVLDGSPALKLGQPTQERYRERARKTHAWAGVPVPKWLKRKGTAS